MKTYDPEQPSLHLEDRNHVTSVDDHVRDKEHRETEGKIEAVAHKTERAEEALQSQVRQINLRKMSEYKNPDEDKGNLQKDGR